MDRWDPTDRKYERSVSEALEYLIERGSCRCYDRLFEGSVEDIKLKADGTAELNVYGKDDTDKKGHWHFVVEFDESGKITRVYNAHRG